MFCPRRAVSAGGEGSGTGLAVLQGKGNGRSGAAGAEAPQRKERPRVWSLSCESCV